jgi:serine/threonine protein kinase/tetratricopeptide (TPR) repeat protein
MTCPKCGARVTAAGLCDNCRRLPDDATLISAAPTLIAAPNASAEERTLVTPHLDETGTTQGIAIDPPPASRVGGSGGNTGPLRVGQAFGTRYHVIKVLGVGGMGAVYQVWDAELGQGVALKVVRPEAAGDPLAAKEMERRFKQELVLARQVTHKNVVRIHDLGEINGIKYITMPYLEGSDLATVLKQEGKLPVPAALRIVRDVVAGLVAAHEAGIVHRDLKPANIMLVGDQAIIMDFGIARSAGAPAAQPTDETRSGAISTLQAPAGATMVGTIIGTVEYMAPEQAKGETVDERADLYALGLIFSDLLLGRRRKSGGSALEELKKRIEQVPPPVRTVDATIPEAVEAVISRCLEPDPASRFLTSAELVAALDRLDENGRPLPIHRVVGMKGMAAAVVLFLVLLAGTWWFARGPSVPVEHDPVSVVIADFQNGTGDPAFDRTLEPVLKLALESAGFISAYSRSEISRNLGVQPPDDLSEQSAREIATKQGLGVVLSGSVQRQGSGYSVSVKAIQAVTGDVITDTDDRASSKEQVLSVATGLATTVREALGDDTSDSAKRFAMETLSATSLDVVHEYAGAMEALSRSGFETALQGFSRAVARDQKFGLAYAGMAIASRNLGRFQDAEKYAKQAVSHVDSMTERERYRTRGLYYMVTSDYQACVKEYGDLIARYAADAAARNNLALCSTYLRDIRRALDEMKQVVKILPGRALYRENLSTYLSYGGDFQAAEQEARALTAPGLFGLGALAFAQVGQGQLDSARETYQLLGKIEGGASYMASGLGDVAIFEGRFSDAEKIFVEGAREDLKQQEPDRAAAKLTSVAYARLQRGSTGDAVAAAEEALKASETVKIRFLAARILLEAGQTARAASLAKGLAGEFPVEPQAYARIIEGEIALENGDARQAIQILTSANALLDTWIGHFDLGRAYLEVGAFPQADSEFDRCIGRRGEVMALFLDEEPTYGYLPPVYYYQGRVREGLKTAGFAESYRAYLAIRGNSKEDRLVADARSRASR